MKITIAIDSFKGSLSTFEAGQAASEGIKRVFPDAETVISPIADGGEGTTEAIIGACHGEMRKVAVSDPLGRKINAEYGYIPDMKTAVIEMSSAAGITLVSEAERNPMNTTTYGVGEMILDAIKSGCRNFVVGIGGSATNDGGTGMLSALGFEFLDCDGNRIELGARGLEKLSEIRCDNAHPLLSECTFRIACDVTNPLCGENGCSAIYGPQKGATAENIPVMDKWLANFARLTRTVKPTADENYPGAGAAGGMGFAFMSYLSGKLTSGISLVMSMTGIEEHIKGSDIVITGEGRLDSQSANGKAPVGVASIAKKYGKPVIAFSGCTTADAGVLNSSGIDAFFPILKAPCSLSEAMDKKNAARNLSDTAEQAMRMVKVFAKEVK
ncbi:MAG: glycerate kinase [Clostridia bacterium]|nr:glycerate kinase [Clostridia bacterium]